MIDRSRRRCLAGFLSFCAPVLLSASVWADAYDAPATYYYRATNLINSGTFNAAALRMALHDTVEFQFGSTTSHISNPSYSAIATAIQNLDKHPDTVNNPNDVLLIYNRDRAGKTDIQSSGTTGWNREHIWPASKLGGSTGAENYHDEHNLRPAQPKLNGDRGNLAFGGTNDVASVNGSGSGVGQFSPGQYDRGDVARSNFYMATRYYNGSTTLSASNLNIVATSASETATYQMGDLNALLRFHYQDLPDTFERRRNQLVYTGNTIGSTNYSQGNRNPYIDHPEYVWAVFGDGANDSQLTLDTGSTGGASTKTVNFGRVIVGGTAPALTTSVTINKAGVDPTSYSVTTAGAATAAGVDNGVNRTNIYNAFGYNAGTKSMTVGLTGVSTATANRLSGTVTIDNTDLTTAGSATGSGDGNDTVNLALDVVDHSNASFLAGSDSNSLIINFGAVDKGQTATQSFSLYNLLSASGFTAGLDLDNITPSGDSSMFESGLNGFSALAAGGSNLFAASFTPTAGGTFSATYTLAVSDENLSGATAGTSLSLTLTGVANSFTVPEPAFLAIAPMLAIVLRRRRAA